MKYEAIVLASGNSSRANIGYNKIFYKINNMPIIVLSCKNFIDDCNCQKVIVTYSNENEKAKLQELFSSEKIVYIKGGITRQKSVQNALSEITSEYVLIHDGARPFVSIDLINRLIEKLNTKNAVIPVIDVIDTIKMVKDSKVVKTLNRDELKIVQTPQAFKTSLIKKAHQLALNNLYFDDASLIEEVLKEEVYVIPGERSNIKLTYKEDFRG